MQALEVPESYGAKLGIHGDADDPLFSSCSSAIAYSNGASSAHVSLDLPTGTYTIVASATAILVSEPYAVTSRSLRVSRISPCYWRPCIGLLG